MVLAVQDTTDLDFSSHRATAGLGRIGNGHGRGLYAHTTLAITPAGLPLGLLGQQVWVRPLDQPVSTVSHKARPIAELDLTDAIAQVVHCPFAALSLEMVYRRLHFFTYAFQQGQATDVVQYLAADATALGIRKRKATRDPPPSRFAQLPLTLA